jgi:hypothetical protein
MKFLETAFHLNTDSGTCTITYLDMEGDRDKLTLVSKMNHVSLETFKISAKMDSELLQDLKQFHAVDGEAMAIQAIERESFAQRQKKLSEVYHTQGDKTSEELLSRKKKIIRKIFPKVKFQEYVTNMASEGSENLVRSIMVKSNMIAARSRRGGGDFILCGRSTATLIQDHSSFVHNTDNFSLSDFQTISSIGVLNGRMQVYVDNNMKFSDSTIIVGRFTKANESGVYIVENKGSRELVETMLSESDKNIYLNERLAFKATDNAHLNFIKYEVSFTKKPLWKRILGI